MVHPKLTEYNHFQFYLLDFLGHKEQNIFLAYNLNPDYVF
jgi:hypothetical protein